MQNAEPRKIDLFLIVAVFLSILLVSTMSGCGSVNKDYILADEATYNALEPTIELGIANEEDKELQEDLKALVISWKSRIEAAKKSLGEKK